MTIRLGTVVIASLASILTLGTVGASAQTHGDKALNFLVGQWYSPKGDTIEFLITREIPKFRHKLNPTGFLEGSYKAGEGGADYVLEYADGLKCYYDVDIGSASDTKEIVFALRRASPDHKGGTCIQGVLHRMADRR